MDFSLLFFSGNEAEPVAGKYDLLLESAKFADTNGFKAIWLPERHFHFFGGLYPNPSVLAAALSVVTHNIRLRAGSVVLPLHHPVRVAEEWSVVDNLSAGRVDLSFVRGWNANDFILAPENFPDRTAIMYRYIDIVRRLWKGDEVVFKNALDKETPVRIYPSPVQQDVAVWVTCTDKEERFAEAGRAGANVLTGLLFQHPDQLAGKIGIYREARAAAGYDPDTGIVSLMLHTYIGGDADAVKKIVREPFTEYIRSSIDLWRQMMPNLENLSDRDQEQVLAFAFERYYRINGLFGTPESCLPMVRQLRNTGVNEIACLIDFGIAPIAVLDALPFIKALQTSFQSAEVMSASTI
jgi:natural product biosynthesis luciferase-like monooxygenase protein